MIERPVFIPFKIDGLRDVEGDGTAWVEMGDPFSTQLRILLAPTGDGDYLATVTWGGFPMMSVVAGGANSCLKDGRPHDYDRFWYTPYGDSLYPLNTMRLEFLVLIGEVSQEVLEDWASQGEDIDLEKWLSDYEGEGETGDGRAAVDFTGLVAWAMYDYIQKHAPEHDRLPYTPREVGF